MRSVLLVLGSTILTPSRPICKQAPNTHKFCVLKFLSQFMTSLPPKAENQNILWSSTMPRRQYSKTEHAQTEPPCALLCTYVIPILRALHTSHTSHVHSNQSPHKRHKQIAILWSNPHSITGRELYSLHIAMWFLSGELWTYLTSVMHIHSKHHTKRHKKL
jgi:hypothetical protein